MKGARVDEDWADNFRSLLGAGELGKVHSLNLTLFVVHFHSGLIRTSATRGEACHASSDTASPLDPWPIQLINEVRARYEKGQLGKQHLIPGTA